MTPEEFAALQARPDFGKLQDLLFGEATATPAEKQTDAEPIEWAPGSLGARLIGRPKLRSQVVAPIGKSKRQWLKTGLPPDGWHKTPLCGLLRDIERWAGTTDKTLHSRNGQRWWVTEWTGSGTPYAIYFPTPQQYGDAVNRRDNPKSPKPAGGNRRKSERTGALRTKAKRK